MWLLKMLYLQTLYPLYLSSFSPSEYQCEMQGKTETDCGHQSLVSIPHSLSNETETLLLNVNSFTNVSLSSLKSLANLKELILSDNQIERFDPDYSLPLETLDLSSNSLTSVPNFSNLTTLRILTLDHNKIPDLPEGAFDDLLALEELSLRGNTIRVIPAHIFDPLEELRNVFLSGNRIEKFPENSFLKTHNLDKFDISNNNLRTIPQDFVILSASYIHLYNNPWHCDCDTVRILRDWISKIDGNIYNSEGVSDSRSVVCQTPTVWKGIPIIDLPFDQTCPIVTTIGMIPQTPTETLRSQVRPVNTYLLKTSPTLEICPPFTDLQGKRGTNCSHQSLVSIPHSLSQETEILLLNDNNLTSVSLTSFKSLSKLKELTLTNNQIQHFDPDYSLPLEKLEISSNSLTSLPNFSNLTTLRVLILDHNKIPDLPEGAFDDLLALEELSLRGNTIRVIPEQIFDRLEEITVVILSGNRIEKFPGNPLHNAENLDKFDISNNNLRTIPADFVNLFPPYIYLYNNPWHCDCDTVRIFSDWINEIEDSIYNSEGVSDSRSVVCRTPIVWKGIPIIDLPFDQICPIVTTIGMIPQTPTETERPQVSTVNTYLLKTSPSLEICPPFTDLQGKRGTNCSHQSLVSIPHSLSQDTEILLLNDNNLTSVSLTSFKSLSKLKDLDLSNNQIQHFDPDYSLPLEKLEISSNSLTSIPNFSNLTTLRILTLDHNKIPDLPEGAFDDLLALEELSLRGNTIRVIPEHIFDRLEEITVVILSGNRIEKFPGNPLHNAENLDKFDISSNNLRTIPADFVNLFPPYIYLYDNPWHCDCDTVRIFSDWINEIEDSIYNSEGVSNSSSVVCQTPIVWKGIAIIDLPFDQICPIVTTIGMIPQTPTETERPQVSTVNTYLLKTSPTLEICPPFTDLQGKRGTNCSHQSLVSIPHSLSQDTEILLLNDNNLTSVSLTSFKSLSKLKELNLTNNQIQHFDPDYSLPLEKLEISSNSLTTIPNFSNLTTLRILILDHNKIPDLPEGAFDDLLALEELSLRGNTIRVIPEHIFDRLEEITVVILSGNRIEKFPGNPLHNAENLDKFDISSNNLRTIPADFVNLFPPYIYLYDNPWHCDCDTVRIFSDWINEIEDSIYNSEGVSESRSVVCQTPTVWNGTAIIDLPFDQICPIVTTIGMIPQTPTVTDRPQVRPVNTYLLKTSPSLEICPPFTDLQGKRGTNCSHQSLVSIPHSLSQDTEILLLNDNNLTSVSLTSFKSLSKLKDLDLSNNQIQHFDPDYSLPLEKLEISSNSLTSVPNFSNLTTLRILILDHNKIPDLPEGAFDDLLALEELSLRGNTIRVIPEQIFDRLEEITVVILSGNRIEKFPGNPLHNAENLDKFDISNNNLRTIPADFVNLFPPYIYLYDNPWHCDCDTVRIFSDWINEIEDSIYNSEGVSDSRSVVCRTPIVWKGIAIIDLPFDQICPIVTTIGMIPQTPTETDRPQVSTVNTYLLKTSPSLEICPPFTDLQGKRGTNCSHQSLVSIPHSLSQETEILLLNDNNLTSVSLTSFKSLSKLRDLDLSNNQIQHFDPDYSLPLEKLEISSNSLTSVPNFSNLTTLRILTLDHNKIPDLPEGAFDDLLALEELSLRGNTIRVIPEQIFDRLEEITVVILSGNRIEKFPGNPLHNAENLDKFDISNNNLRTIPADFVNLFPPYIYLYDNPWHCDCDTVRIFSDWINEIEDSIYNSEGVSDSRSVVCRTPIVWKGIPIIDLPFDQICPIVTTIGMIPQTPTETERPQVRPVNTYLLKTSPTLEICPPFTDLQGKRGTNCSHQSLVSIPHSLSQDTEILLLNDNNLTSVSLTSFKSLSKLKELDLTTNQIQHFDPDYSLPLEKLEISSNSLTSLPNFSNLTTLRVLILDHNKIPDLPEGAFDDLLALEELSLRGNTIRVIPEQIFDPLGNLKHLILSANRIGQLPENSFLKAQTLDKFDISNNNLRSIPQDFMNLSAPYIYLYNNPWHCDCDTVRVLRDWISKIDGNIYNSEGESDSRSVVCQTPTVWKGIAIIDLPFDQISPIVTTIGMIPQTPTVTLRSQVRPVNTYLLKTSPTLEICPPFTDLQGKRGSNCSHQSLVSIPHSLSQDTEILLLNDNNLTSVSLTSFKSLSKLKELNLTNNQIQHFDPDYPLPLEKLEISSNSLTSLPNFSNLTTLRILILDHNKIPDLPEGAFDDLLALEELSLRGNIIRVIPEQIFDRLGELRYLILSGNRIQSLPNNPLTFRRNLTALDVSNNELRTIPRELFERDPGLCLHLHGNPWHCDCDIQYVTRWMKLTEGKKACGEGAFNDTGVHCNSPPHMGGLPLVQLDPSVFCTASTSGQVTPTTLRSPGTRLTSQSHLGAGSPEGAVKHRGHGLGLLEALSDWGSCCFLLFLLHCLSLGLLLLSSCLLLFCTVRFHRRCYAPMKRRAQAPFGIRLVRYSLLGPQPCQIYPSPDGQPDGITDSGSATG
ncbi:uncharacterized protein LOC119958299 [Scyliorhinus canicula]|uniref:uncharacterized protein LOC119958299 n=1 Tax=Scyliorhinus canicula TaxID=7830 RepID=UPI0018F34B56|nr:uncharacterized protein LOC119958299 [Scyliorhinus canicula]